MILERHDNQNFDARFQNMASSPSRLASRIMHIRLSPFVAYRNLLEIVCHPMAWNFVSKGKEDRNPASPKLPALRAPALDLI